MTAEASLPEQRRRSFARWAAPALLIATLAAIGGWLHTVRELNRLACYEVVGAEALRLARSARAEKAPGPAIYVKKCE